MLAELLIQDVRSQHLPYKIVSRFFFAAILVVHPTFEMFRKTSALFSSVLHIELATVVLLALLAFKLIWLHFPKQTVVLKNTYLK